MGFAVPKQTPAHAQFVLWAGSRHGGNFGPLLLTAALCSLNPTIGPIGGRLEGS